MKQLTFTLKVVAPTEQSCLKAGEELWLTRTVLRFARFLVGGSLRETRTRKRAHEPQPVRSQ